ncbi:alpha/beta hydrolase family protein [Psychroflexus planctonicus]|uniref:Alpha/beta hydrolase n=1 Tax=Psychroflexus planctonicus TaxID=1526575 RepID=A0ABQ1SGA4_9FLAO|nr:alpha/beta fold hydrolase [Psychroflexus planctonicus]GGE37863.1 alpha/beta hydrolase [Psychroflexus planctonicus]
MQNKEFTLSGKHQKNIVGDVTFQENSQPKALVIFCHGYKGFKDWGAWHLIANAFAEAGFFFVKFNFSHNGIGSENSTEFSDLEAFGMDNFSKQLDDLNSVIQFFEGENEFSSEIDFSKLSLIGHSRGGGIAVINANEDARVKKLITWAGVSDFGNRFPKGKKLEQWKKDGVYHIVNGRTKQKMPHYIQFYEDFLDNQKRFHIKTAVEQLQIPYLVMHGTHDETVNVEEAEILFDHSTTSKIKWIANANHVFAMKHPWEKSSLPLEAKVLVKESITFLKK